MPASIPCNPCCDVPLSVNVPGAEGADGADGANGINAFSFVTAPGFNTPASVGAPATIPVDTNEWMVIGQIIVFDGPATFRVTSVDPNGVSVTGVYLDYDGDVGVNQPIAIGDKVSPSGTQPALTTSAAIAEGTAYDLLDTGFALIDFTGVGSVDPSITLAAAGKYLLFASARVGLTNATNGGVTFGTVGIRLQRTNNTPGTVPSYQTINPAVTSPANAEAYRDVPITTAATDVNGFEIVICPVVYETASAGDIIQLWANASLPPAGALQITVAQIIAVRIS